MAEVLIGLEAKGERVPQCQIMLLGSNERGPSARRRSRYSRFCSKKCQGPYKCKGKKQETRKDEGYKHWSTSIHVLEHRYLPYSASSPCEMLEQLGKLDEADGFGNEWM